MARRCAICGKGPGTGHAVSHSNIKTHRRWNANLQKIKVFVDGRSEKAYVCTRCLRSGKAVRAV